MDERIKQTLDLIKGFVNKKVDAVSTRVELLERKALSIDDMLRQIADLKSDLAAVKASQS